MIDVSIIIVNYNTCKITSNCVDSVVEKTHGVDYEIILVDNASTDGSNKFFEKDNRVKYIYSEKNGGFGYGNNLGMKVAKGKYFFLLNSDTLLINNAVKQFFDYAESENEKIIYGAYLLHSDGTFFWPPYFYFPSFTIKDFIKRFFRSHNRSLTPNQVINVEAICGAAMFFNRDAFEKTLGFDENIFLYGEESELQFRMRKVGYTSCLIPTPKIIHLEGQSMKASPSKKAISLKSHFYVLKKHMNYPTYLLARLYYMILLGLINVSHCNDTEYRDFFKTLFSL